MNRTVSTIMLSLLLLSAFAFAIGFPLVKAVGETVYIRSDGSVDPPTAPILFDNGVYSLTDNINGSIVVEKNDTVLDGAGHLLQGAREMYSVGIYVLRRSNAEIKNFEIRAFWTAVELWDSSNSRIIGNNLIDNEYFGVGLTNSHNNTISGNTAIDNNGIGIAIKSSMHNNITDNRVSGSRGGIWVTSYASNNIISSNTATSNEYGVVLFHRSNYNAVTSNNLTNNVNGISIWTSSNNTLRNNVLRSNSYSFDLFAYEFSDYFHDVDASNTVDERPVYYWVNRRNEEVPSDAGFVALVNSTYITVKNLSLRNNGAAIVLAKTSNSTIQNSNLTNNLDGISLFGASGNIITNNDLAQNERDGIVLQSSSQNEIAYNNITENKSSGIYISESSQNQVNSNNLIGNGYGVQLIEATSNKLYNNNFVGNSVQASVQTSHFTSYLGNAWDNGYDSGGNYWSGYTGMDMDDDGVGDIPYIVSSWDPYRRDQDRYPLMERWTPFVHDVAVVGVVPSTNEVYVGQDVNITAVIKNVGNIVENVSVSFKYQLQGAEHLIGTQTVSSILPGTNATLTYKWITTDVTVHTIMVKIQRVPGERNTTDNVRVSVFTVKVKMTGDLDGNDQVDIRDLAKAALSFGRDITHPLWNPDADVNDDDRVDIRDLVLIAKNFGKVAS